MGGEPTFVLGSTTSIAEWNTIALGQSKRLASRRDDRRLHETLRARRAPAYGEGNGIRAAVAALAFSAVWERDGVPALEPFRLLAPEASARAPSDEETGASRKRGNAAWASSPTSCSARLSRIRR